MRSPLTIRFALWRRRLAAGETAAAVSRFRPRRAAEHGLHPRAGQEADRLDATRPLAARVAYPRPVRCLLRADDALRGGGHAPHLHAFRGALLPLLAPCAEAVRSIHPSAGHPTRAGAAQPRLCAGAAVLGDAAIAGRGRPLPRAGDRPADVPLRNPDDYGRDFDRLLALYRAATGDDTDGLLPCRDNFAAE